MPFSFTECRNSRDARKLEIVDHCIEYVNRTGNITSQFLQSDNRWKKRNKTMENNRKEKEDSRMRYKRIEQR
jgi:hypothetical protein